MRSRTKKIYPQYALSASTGAVAAPVEEVTIVPQHSDLLAVIFVIGLLWVIDAVLLDYPLVS